MHEMGWPQAWAIIGVLGSLVLGVGGIAITVLISMRTENRVAHEQIGKRIDDGLAGVNQRIDDGFANVNQRIDDGLAGVNARIDDGLVGANQRIDDSNAGLSKRLDDLRDLLLTLVQSMSGRPHAEPPDQPGQAGQSGA